MWQRFTKRARKAISNAYEEAEAFGAGAVCPEHLLLGIIRETDAIAARALEHLGLSLSGIREKVEEMLPRRNSRATQRVPIGEEAKRVLDFAYEESKILNQNYIGTEHLLLGLLASKEDPSSRVIDLLGVDQETTRNAVVGIYRETDRLPMARELGFAVPDLGLPPEDAWEDFDEHARAALSYARQHAHISGEGHLDTEHLLFGLIRHENSPAARVLQHLGASLIELLVEVKRQMPRPEGPPNENPVLTPRAKRVVCFAREEVESPNLVGSEHLLLGLIRESGGGGGRILAQVGINLEEARSVVLALPELPKREIAASDLAELVLKRNSEIRSRREIASTVVAKLFFNPDGDSSCEFLATSLLADPFVRTCLDRLSVDPGAAIEWVKDRVVDRFFPPSKRYMTSSWPSLPQLLSLASIYARKRGQVTTAELLIAFFIHGDNSLAKFLVEQGVTFESLNAALKETN